MKKTILKISVVVAFIAIAIISLSIVNHFKVPTTYEYYTFDNLYGTSSKCSSKDKIECKINGVMVEVKQFSEK